ncbi:glutathione S-transferase domain-containing protein [Kalymmatonema gypsitolerans NIES-4073]|nr:glutathione S-transferase domain-containing protein [Scytonema sp. NIES-4073]
MLVTVGFLIENLKIMVKLTVYGTPASTYVRTVRLLLEEAGVDYTLKGVDIFNGENQSAEYLAKNPFGKVPTLEVDGQLLYETGAITEYLDTVLAEHKFSPSDPMLQARMRQIMAIIDSYLYAPAIGTIVVQRLIVPTQGGKADEEKVKNAVAPAQTALKAIESLAVASPYLLGSELSIADFYLIPIFIYLSQTPEFEATTAQTPKLRTWWDKVNQLENVKKVSA